MKTKIAEIRNEGDDGWWLYYAPGWKSSTDPVGNVHAEHESTKREVLALAKVAMPCDCDECEQIKDSESSPRPA